MDVKEQDCLLTLSSTYTQHPIHYIPPLYEKSKKRSNNQFVVWEYFTRVESIDHDNPTIIVLNYIVSITRITIHL